MRGRSYSYSPSPPRSNRRRGRSPSPRGRYGGRSRDMPTSLLVRNLRHGCKSVHSLLHARLNYHVMRSLDVLKMDSHKLKPDGGPDDLRKPFGQFGPLKDIYLPRDYYTGEPRGFGFIQYVDPADATEAKYQMDGQILFGRELTVVFAEENRKKPTDMRARERVSRRYDRRSPRHAHSPQYSRSRSPRYSRSPCRGRSRPHRQSYHSPLPRRRSYSPSPKKHSYSPSPKKRSYLPSPRKREYSRSASPDDQMVHTERSYSRSPMDNRSRSRSPYEEKQRDLSRSVSQ